LERRKRHWVSQKKEILYTSQSISEPFPHCFLEAMRMSPEFWIWLIRLHPRQRNKLVEIIDKFLQGKGLDNYEMKPLHNLPIFGEG